MRGVEVRRVFHELRSWAIENFNGQLKSILDGQGQAHTKGLANTVRFALGAIFVYQLALYCTSMSITGISEWGSKPSSRQREL